MWACRAFEAYALRFVDVLVYVSQWVALMTVCERDVDNVVCFVRLVTTLMQFSLHSRVMRRLGLSYSDSNGVSRTYVDLQCIDYVMITSLFRTRRLFQFPFVAFGRRFS